MRGATGSNRPAGYGWETSILKDIFNRLVGCHYNNAATSAIQQIYSFQNSYRGLGQLEIRLPMQDSWDRKNQMKTATKEIEKSMANKDNVILELRQKIITQYNQLIVNQKILKNANESVIAGAMNKEMGDKEFLNGQSTLLILPISWKCTVLLFTIMKHQEMHSSIHTWYCRSFVVLNSTLLTK